MEISHSVAVLDRTIVVHFGQHVCTPGLLSYQAHYSALDYLAVAAVVKLSVRQPKHDDGKSNCENAFHWKLSFRVPAAHATTGCLHGPYDVPALRSKVHARRLRRDEGH